MPRPSPTQPSAERLVDGRKIPMMIIGGVVAGMIAALFALSTTLKARALDRLDRQIKELYGPLDSRIATNTSYWLKFCEENCPNGGTFFGEGPSAPRDVALWRSYITSSGLPDVKNMSELIESHGDLIVGDKLPPSFAQLTDHRKAYELLVAKWASAPPTCTGNYADCDVLFASANVATTPWPSALSACVSQQLAELRRARTALASTPFVLSEPVVATAEACTL